MGQKGFFVGLFGLSYVIICNSNILLSDLIIVEKALGKVDVSNMCL